ncbi:MAG: amidohydrolase [Deltaproteobacteria bacterium]|nr:amidohydrolase [Deltaproteobacteria bacterium]
MLRPKMPSINDQEDSKVPDGLPPLIDAHVHIFPRTIFSAIWKWFDNNAWHIRYQMTSSGIFEFLLSRGVKHIIALQYAHKPGIAKRLNDYMSEKCKAYDGRVTGMATVFPGEDNAEGILQAAFDSGLSGLKLHAHVQCFDMNGEQMNRLYECCQINKKPIVMHIGREPKSTAYGCDPYQLCSAERLEHVLNDFPALKICVPHMGFDEISAYRELIEKYDNLWLDTTMVITDYFPIEEKTPLEHYRSDRIMYGSDFPNIPYSWDRELKELKAVHISHEVMEKICYKNAVDFFSLKGPPF